MLAAINSASKTTLKLFVAIPNDEGRASKCSSVLQHIIIYNQPDGVRYKSKY